MDPNNQSEEDKLNWDQLTDSQKELVTKNILQVKKMKFILLAVGTLFMSAQPILNNYWSNRAADRAAEAERLEKTTNAAGSLNKIVLERLIDFNAQMVELRGENEKLRSVITELQNNVTKLKEENAELKKKINPSFSDSP